MEDKSINQVSEKAVSPDTQYQGDSAPQSAKTNISDSTDRLSTNNQIDSSDTAVSHAQNASDYQTTEDNEQITLDSLPSEILLHICTFLDARFVLSTITHVCKFFNELVSDDLFWKLRIKKRWPKKYPPVPVEESDFNWKEACVDREQQFRRWMNPAENLDYFRYTHALSSPVDSVHLFQGASLLAIGSRDRYLNVVDLTKLDGSDPAQSMRTARMFSKMEAHKGWIWSMASQDSVLASGSWDMHVKFWDMAAGGEVIRDVKCKSALLALHYEQEFMVAGGFDKKVYHIDPRASAVLAEKRYHKKPVLAVAANENYVMTGSEDSTLAFYDRRADAVIKTLQLSAFPMCMSYWNNQLWVGDRSGLVHLINTTMGTFDVVQTYNVGHVGKVTGIQYTPGALYTCSMDRTIRVHEPNDNPTTIKVLTDHGAEVASINFENGTLVSAGSDISVGIWKPKSILM